jgi:hypothetical protein
MALIKAIQRSGGAWAVALLSLAAVAAAPAHADDALSPDNVYLDGLVGEWNMSGTVLGRPVRYLARGERVLQGGFLRLHMIDAAAEPQYEADLFLGFDAQAHDYVGHWLDRFGAAGARVVATGQREGERLVINFPYSSGAFRDTLMFDQTTGAWSLLLETQTRNGSWSTFANYTLRRTNAAR